MKISVYLLAIVVTGLIGISQATSQTATGGIITTSEATLFQMAVLKIIVHALIIPD